MTNSKRCRCSIAYSWLEPKEFRLFFGGGFYQMCFSLRQYGTFLLFVVDRFVLPGPGKTKRSTTDTREECRRSALVPPACPVGRVALVALIHRHTSEVARLDHDVLVA